MLLLTVTAAGVLEYICMCYGPDTAIASDYLRLYNILLINIIISVMWYLPLYAYLQVI